MEVFDEHRPDECLSDLVIDRLVAGDFEASRVAEREGHIAQCQRCTERVAAIRSAPPPSEMAVTRGVRMLRAVRQRRWLMPTVAAATAAATLMFFMVVRSRDTGLKQPRIDSQTRTKGTVVLELYAKRSGDVALIRSGEALAPGDAVRFRISTDSPGYLVVAGIDSSGVTTPYLPESGDAVAIDRGKNQIQPSSIVLDDVLGEELFIAVVCPNSISVEKVLEAARLANTLVSRPGEIVALKLDCEQASFLVGKEKSE